MSSTTIIFELILIGFQVLVWTFLLILAVWGYDWLHLGYLKEWKTEISVALVGTAYMFGLVFDKLIGALPFSWTIGGSDMAALKDLPHPIAMRMQILAINTKVYEVIEKRENQNRLLRSTVFNLALISLSALIFVIARTDYSWLLLVFWLFLSVALITLALFTASRSSRILFAELVNAYRALKEVKDSKKADSALDSRFLGTDCGSIENENS